MSVGTENIKALAGSAAGGNDARPILRLGPDVAAIVDRLEEVLRESGAPVYQRGLHLVRPGMHGIKIADDKTAVVAGLQALPVWGVIDEVSRVARFEKWDARSRRFKETAPPQDVARELLSRAGKWKLATVAGVITCPTLRPDGSLIASPGYDAATGLYLVGDRSVVLPPMPEAPTRADALEALALLKGLLEEFPFVRKVDRAVALSLIVSAVVRGALAMVPIHAFTAPTPGTGKSYLGDVVSAMVAGRACPVVAAGGNAEELEKRLGGMLLAGYPLISLDNCSVTIKGDALCQIATQRYVRVRVLGKSEVPEMEFRGVLIVNGNNLSVDDDLVRRVLVGKLDTGMERPELRQFKFDPVERVLAERGKYIAAAMLIVKAYRAAGMPGKLAPIAGFETWSAQVRSALVWLGEADPAESMEEVRRNAPHIAALSAALGAWHAVYGGEARSVRQVVEMLSHNDTLMRESGESPTSVLRTALLVVAGVRGEIDATKLGYWLRKHQGRPAGGRKFVAEEGVAHAGGRAWKIEKV
jgi:putative DNA primase/helicase